MLGNKFLKSQILKKISSKHSFSSYVFFIIKSLKKFNTLYGRKSKKITVEK